MDWIRILEVLVTSVSSIIVALVGAGFFRQMRDKQEKNRSKEKLMEQIKKDEFWRRN